MTEACQAAYTAKLIDCMSTSVSHHLFFVILNSCVYFFTKLLESGSLSLCVFLWVLPQQNSDINYSLGIISSFANNNNNKEKQFFAVD